MVPCVILGLEPPYTFQEKTTNYYFLDFTAQNCKCVLWNRGSVKRNRSQTLQLIHSPINGTPLCSSKQYMWLLMINYAVKSSQPDYEYIPSYQLLAVPGFSTSYCRCHHLAFRPLKPKCCKVQRSNMPDLFVCSFVSQSIESVVHTTSLSDIMDGSTKLPFTTRSAWLTIQPEWPDLRRTCAHLRQGTCSSRKTTNIKYIKCYLNVATRASDGLLVVKQNEPFMPAKKLIIISRSVLHGLLTSIHLQLSHPSANQIRLLWNGSYLFWI